MAKKQCNEKIATTHKSKTTYSIDQHSVNRLNKFIRNNDHAYPVDQLKVIVGLISEINLENVPRHTLFKKFDLLGIGKQVDSLADYEYYALLDFLEDAQFDGAHRVREISAPLSSKNLSAIAIWKEIKKQTLTIAKNHNKKPIALAVTASGRDNFEAADFYISALHALGLEAKWLPISGALVDAIYASKKDQDACDNLDYFRQRYYQFDRARVYPDLHQIQIQYCKNPTLISKDLKLASSIFFNGGDQSKALSAFMHNQDSKMPYLNTMKMQIKHGKLIVIGTSAGTAVQSGGVLNQMPVPMITSGTSNNAVLRGAFSLSAASQRCNTKICENGVYPDDLTYRTMGGLGSFNTGILDTHFSERNREARLIVLSQQTRVKYAFGVDETTALLINQTDKSLDFKVIGEQGVFVVDNQNAEANIGIKDGQHFSAYAGSAHFLPSGTFGSLNLAEYQWEIGYKKSNDAQTKNRNKAIWRGQSFTLCKSEKEVATLRFNIDDYQVLLQKDATTKIFENENYCGYLNLKYAISTF